MRLVPAALATWVSAGVLVGVRDAGVLLALVSAGLWLASAIVLLVLRRTRAGPAIVLVALVSALVSTSVLVHADAREPPDLVSAAAHSRPLEVTVAITGRPAGGRVAGSIGAAPVLLFADLPDIAIGDVVAVRATPARADAGEGVAFLLVARDDVRIVDRADAVLAAADGVRDRFAAVAGMLPGPGAGLLPGLAIGDTSGVAPQLDADMKTSSLSHLTAVSGSNCAVVVGLLFPLCAAAGFARWVRIGIALAGLAGFVILVTPGAERDPGGRDGGHRPGRAGRLATRSRHPVAVPGGDRAARRRSLAVTQLRVRAQRARDRGAGVSGGADRAVARTVRTGVDRAARRRSGVGPAGVPAGPVAAGSLLAALRRPREHARRAGGAAGDGARARRMPARDVRATCRDPGHGAGVGAGELDRRGGRVHRGTARRAQPLADGGRSASRC